MAAAKEISVEASVAAFLSELDGIFERTTLWWTCFFCFDSGWLWQEMR